MMLIYQLRPSVIIVDQLPTDMPKGYTSNVARKTPRKKLMIKADADMREKRRAEAEEQEFDRQAILQHLNERWAEHHKKFPPKKKKKKDTPPRFKLIIPPAH